jgi:membrane carboxypeptidase/penicillin-binding protein
MTIAFGHGISVTPLHLATGSAAMVNGGMLYQPSFVKRTAARAAGAVDPGQDLAADAPAAAAQRGRGHGKNPRSRATRSAARPARPRSRAAAATAKKP